MGVLDTEIDSLHGSFVAAMRAGRLDAVLECLTEDYELWAPGAVPLLGRESLRPALVKAFAAYEIEARFESLERVVSADWAFERGWDVQRIAPRGGGPSVERRQRVFLILRRGGDGRWRYARGMSQPGPEPAATTAPGG